MDININKEDGIIKISEEFSISQAPKLDKPGDEYIIRIDNLQSVSKFKEFEYDSLGLNDQRYLLQYYRTSRNGNNWSEWLDLNRDIQNFPLVDALDPLFVEIKWVRVGSSTIGTIRLLEYTLSGVLERDSEILEAGTIVLKNGESKVVQVSDIFKVFRIDDIEIIPSSNAVVKYRYSQDSTRTWSQWEPLTKENISTRRIDPIRFFQIEYLIENNSGAISKIQDINIIGDFQNISKDYKKSNVFGIRECCQSAMNGVFDSDGNFIPNESLNSTGSGDVCDENVFSPMTDSNKANLYNPYAQNSATNLLEKLSNDAQQMFGHKVTYFVTDPDHKGQDHVLNEFQLYNVVCKDDIKVSIDGNNFPDSQIKMNIFDLDLFESMEAHITKQQFKEIFGKQRRPSKEDFLYFCDVNRLYQVDHAQQFRNFNNSAVFYKLILKKYTQKSNVKAGTPEISDMMSLLTNNSTINELMGIEIKNDKAAVANKQQHTPLTRDPIRVSFKAQIDRGLIENSSSIISKSHYDLSTVPYEDDAIIYENLRPALKVSDNIGYQIWFNINNYIESEKYNFFNMYDVVNNIGWKAYLQDDTIKVLLNNQVIEFELGTGGNDELEEDTWYCYVLNINQRQRHIEQFIYKRDVDDEDDAGRLNTTMLRQLFKDKQDIEPVEYILEDITTSILASDMKITNIRSFVEVIPESTHNKILNQSIIREDSKYLVFADDANAKLVLPRFPLNE